MSKRSIRKLRHRTDGKPVPTFKQSVQAGMAVKPNLATVEPTELEVVEAVPVEEHVHGEGCSHHH